MEARDSLREEISRNVNEDVAEHEVVTWTVTKPGGDTMKVERVTERTKLQVSSSTVQDSKMAVRTLTVRDTVYVERMDSVLVQGSKFQVQGENRPSAFILTLKWIFWIIIGFIGLFITVRVCLRKG